MFALLVRLVAIGVEGKLHGILVRRQDVIFAFIDHGYCGGDGVAARVVAATTRLDTRTVVYFFRREMELEVVGRWLHYDHIIGWGFLRRQIY